MEFQRLAQRTGLRLGLDRRAEPAGARLRLGPCRQHRQCLPLPL